MRSLEWIGAVFAIVLLTCVLTLVHAAFVWLLWPWVVGDLFSGAVKAGTLPASLTLWQCFKLSLLTAALVAPGAKGGSSRRER